MLRCTSTDTSPLESQYALSQEETVSDTIKQTRAARETPSHEPANCLAMGYAVKQLPGQVVTNAKRMIFENRTAHRTYSQEHAVLPYNAVGIERRRPGIGLRVIALLKPTPTPKSTTSSPTPPTPGRDLTASTTTHISTGPLRKSCKQTGQQSEESSRK